MTHENNVRHYMIEARSPVISAPGGPIITDEAGFPFRGVLGRSTSGRFPTRGAKSDVIWAQP